MGATTKTVMKAELVPSDGPGWTKALGKAGVVA